MVNLDNPSDYSEGLFCINKKFYTFEGTKKQDMKPFDYLKATDGESVITRDGRKVLEIKVFEAEIQYCIVAYIEGEDVLRTYDITGKFTGKESSLDLFMAPKEQKEWIVRRTRPNSGKLIIKGPFDSKVDAELYTLDYPDASIHEITVTE